MYEDTTYEVILRRMLDRVPDRFDRREGSVIWDTHSPTAIELQILYLELDTILREAYGDTASREFLILRCRERGIYPYQATKAVLRGVFTPPAIDVTGQRFNIGDINYTVTEKITDGEYRVECETAGKTGNRFLGTMIPMEYIKGLQTAELTGILIPGEDEEDTEELRQRYFRSFDERAFGGNRRDYLEKTESVPGVGRAKVTRVWNGDIRPAEMIPSAEVTEWYRSVIGGLDGKTAEWLSTVYTAACEKKLTVGGTVLLTVTGPEGEPASDVLVQTVQTAVDPERNAGEGYGLAPVGHVVTVKSAVPVKIEVSTIPDFDEGYSWNSVKASAEDAVAAYLLELRKEWADHKHTVVRVSRIEACMLAVQGVADIRDTKLNGTAENIILGEYEIPVPGGVNV